jgi:hypothetical protein
MILPSKHLPAERALLTIGARLLAHLERPMTISALWQEMQKARSDAAKHAKDQAASLGFDWFILALDLLYLLGAVHLRDGLLVRNAAATEEPA